MDLEGCNFIVPKKLPSIRGSNSIGGVLPTIKLGTAVSAAEAAEAASTVPLHAFALWDPFGEHPPL